MNAKKLMRILAAILLVAILLSIYQVSLLFSESLYFKKNSWSYFTILADDVKQIPVFDPVEDSVSYRYGIGDGTTDTVYSVMYKTTLNKMILLGQYEHYFESNGQLRVIEPLWPSAIFYEASHGRYQVDVENTGNNINSVTIDFIAKAPVRQGHPLKDPTN